MDKIDNLTPRSKIIFKGDIDFNKYDIKINCLKTNTKILDMEIIFIMFQKNQKYMKRLTK
jgi:hypothetical protein